jgi:cation/acetate symporter
LSSADGLLLAIANAFSHDIYYKMIDPGASTQRRLVLSKMLLLVAAVAAACVASLRPDDILFLVSLALSFAAATFFPALVLGIFWKRTNRWGAACGMLTGFGLTLYYALATHPFFGGSAEAQWFAIAPIAAGIFGIPAGFAASVLVSLLTAPPPAAVQDLVERVRYPGSDSDEAAQ